MKDNKLSKNSKDELKKLTQSRRQKLLHLSLRFSPSIQTSSRPKKFLKIIQLWQKNH